MNNSFCWAFFVAWSLSILHLRVLLICVPRNLNESVMYISFHEMYIVALGRGAVPEICKVSLLFTKCQA